MECCQNNNTICSKSNSGPIVGRSVVPGRSVLFLGSYPDKAADTHGVPICGQRKLYFEQNYLHPFGLSANNIAYVNALLCHKQKPPVTAQNLRKCRPNVVSAIKHVSPRLIVAMGNEALHCCFQLDRREDHEDKKETKVTGIERWQNKLFWHEEFNCFVLPVIGIDELYRWTKTFRRHFERKQMQAALKNALQVLGQPKPDVFSQLSVELIDDPDDAHDILSDLLHEKYVGCDIETTGLDPQSNRITGMSFSHNGLDGYFITWRALDENLHLLETFLCSDSVTKIWHNIAFDEKFLTIKGIRFGGKNVDTQIAAFLIDENFPYGLKDSSWRYLCMGGYEMQLENYKRKHKVGFDEAPVEVLYPYACYDAIATYQLWLNHRGTVREGRGFMHLLKAYNMSSLFYDLMMPIRRVFTQVEMAGFRVDTQAAIELNERCEQAKEQLLKLAYDAAGEEFNINSTPQKRKLFIDKFGEEPLKLSKKTKLPSMDAAFMEHMAENAKNPKAREVAVSLSEVAYIKHKQSNYINKVINFVWEDGRVRTNYNVCGTVTGRPSSKNPNTHNIPRDAALRTLYVASPGRVLVGADMHTSEMRFMAAYSQEQALLSAFENDIDLHEQTYRLMFDKPDDYTPTKDERSQAKTINFGLIFGIQVPKLARDMKITQKRAKELMSIYFKKLPRVNRWLQSNAQFTYEHGYALSFFNRRRRLRNIRNDDDYLREEAVRMANNAPIQSASSDYCFTAIVRIYNEIQRRGLKATMVHSVHDCVILDTPPEEVEEIKEIIETAFITPIDGVPCPMKVDIEVEDKWGEENTSQLTEILGKVKQTVEVDGEGNKFLTEFE